MKDAYDDRLSFWIKSSLQRSDVIREDVDDVIEFLSFIEDFFLMYFKHERTIRDEKRR